MVDLLPMRDRFLKDHARINQFAAELIDVLNVASPPDSIMLSKARWAFASTLMQHLAIKERHLYAKLEGDGRPEVTQAFAASKADLLRRFDRYAAHMEAWPTGTAIGSWSTYRPKAIEVVLIFTDRFKNEERDLFGLIDRFDIDISTPSPITLNWARKAFEVKAKVDER
jgi:hypothetical protein